MIQAETTYRRLYQKTHNLKQQSFLLISIILLVNSLFSSTTLAQGVAAGTDISNTATVNYKIGGVDQTPIEGSPTGNNVAGIGNGTPTQFIVDRKIDLLLTGNSSTSVLPGSPQAELSFTLLNEGNDIQEFSITPNSLISADDFDTSSCTQQIVSVTGTPLTGVVLPTSDNIKLMADQQATISIKCDIPLISTSGSTLSIGNSSLLSLIASAVKNGDGSPTTQSNNADIENGIDTVFADNAGTDDLQQDAKHSARGQYLISNNITPPSISIDKSILKISDTSGGSTAIPGSEVSYSIIINTSGTGIISNLVVTDPTPAGMAFKAGSMILDNTTLTDSNDTDNADFGISNTNTATIRLGNITAGSLHQIQLTYIIN